MTNKDTPSNNTQELSIFELAKKFQCYSHGYMCEGCPQPAENEIVGLLEALIKSQTNQAVLEALDRVDTEVIGHNDPPSVWSRVDGAIRNKLRKEQRQKLATLRKELTQETKK